MVDTYQFILHIKGPDLDQDFHLQVGITTVGRDPGNTLVLIDPLISRHHARIDCTRSVCAITDLNSANGTFVNGQKITPSVTLPLENRAVIAIGPIEIRLEWVIQDQEKVETTSSQNEPVISATPQEAVNPSSQTKSLLPEELPENKDTFPPPGLSFYSTRLINYLPGAYQDDFMSRFLALFESILIPIEWNIDNFDLFMDPATAPASYLPWLMNWFQITFNSTWREDQRRKLLKEANQIYRRRGTRWALARVLEIYLELSPEIIEFSEDLKPYTFSVKIPRSQKEADRELIEELININKPAYTSYTLEFLDE